MDHPTDSHFTGRTALVTGASRGIGRAIAERLAADAVLVAVHYAHQDEAAQAVVRAIEQAGGQAFPVRAELGVEGDLDTLFAALEAGLRRFTGQTWLDILVNNAAVRAGAIERVTPEEFERVFSINVRAPFFLIQRALPLLREGGRIINISSSDTRIAVPEELAYAMTKGAIDVLGRTLAVALGGRGIAVNTVAPGPTVTEANAAWLRDSPAIADPITSVTALGRLGQPRDIADVVAFLASEDARWITGQVLDVSGGLFLGGPARAGTLLREAREKK
jgi:NAD(P)-dependent dehydrogenase (short-subunit alcohol dehydrogenase family)